MHPKEWREGRNLTQEDVAEMLGVYQGTVSKIETDGSASVELAAKYEEISKGKVTFVELTHPKFHKASGE